MGLGGTSEFEHGQAVWTHHTVPIRREAELGVEGQCWGVVCRNCNGEGYPFSAGECFSNQQCADAAALHARVDYQQGNTQLLRFVVSADAQNTCKLPAAVGAKEEVLTGLNVFDGHRWRKAIYDAKKTGFLFIGERGDRSDCIGNVTAPMIDVLDRKHAFVLPNVRGNLP